MHHLLSSKYFLVISGLFVVLTVAIIWFFFPPVEPDPGLMSFSSFGAEGATWLARELSEKGTVMVASSPKLLVKPSNWSKSRSAEGELGKAAEEYHREIGIKVFKSGVHFFITVGSLSNLSRESAIKSGFKESDTRRCRTAAEAAGVLAGVARQGDVVLVKGSRRLKMEEVIECFTTCYTR